MSFTQTVTTSGDTVTTIWRTNANDTFDEDEDAVDDKDGDWDGG